MPAAFLTPAQRASYGQYVESPSQRELEDVFFLDDFDRLRVGTLADEADALGCAVQLATLRFLGRFPKLPADLPPQVVAHLAAQLDIEDPKCLARYWNVETVRRHRREIAAAYGYRRFNDPGAYSAFVRWLLRRAWLADPRPALLFDEAVAHLMAQRVILPGLSVLERLVARTVRRAELRAQRLLCAALDPSQQSALEAILVPDEDEFAPLDQLESRPTSISSVGICHAAHLIADIQALNCNAVDVSRVPARRIQRLAQYASVAGRSALTSMDRQQRVATLLAYVRVRHTTTTDDALDLLDLVVGKMITDARSCAKDERRKLRDAFPAATLELYEACSVILDDAVDPARLRSAVFALVSRRRLDSAMRSVEEAMQSEHDLVLEYLVAKSVTVQRFLPNLIRSVTFDSDPSGQPVLEAVAFLNAQTGRPSPTLDGAPLDGLSRRWRRQVVSRDGSVNRSAYSVWVAHELRNRLRGRDVHVAASTHWDDPFARLIRREKWPALQGPMAAMLELPEDGATAARLLAEVLDARLRAAARRLPSNPHAKIHVAAGREPHVSLEPLRRQETSPSLAPLEATIAEWIPRVELPGLLLEVNSWTGFLSEFVHVGRQRSRSAGLDTSLAAVLMAEGCNLDLSAVADPDVPALAPGRLAWVRRCYFRNETLARANARLVAEQSAFPVTSLWGGGELASVDGLRFVVPVRALHAGYSRKYFGNQPGATWYNYLSDRFAGFHAKVIPGTLRDSIFILDGLLEHETSANPSEIVSDTAGASELVFALFHLLGFQFSPRLRPFSHQRMWRADMAADYGPLGDVARHRVALESVEAHWADMLRLAASLKTGRVRASEVMRALGTGSRSSGLRRALHQVGRVAKTLHLLDFMDDEPYRRRIITQLNRSESRHKLARTLFFGHRGQLRRGYRDGQEEQLSALGLLLNVVVLWNTQYIDHILRRVDKEGITVRPGDVAHITPLIHRHIRLLGHYDFQLPPQLAGDRLRPLRRP